MSGADYGIDLDRVGAAGTPTGWLRRRIRGRFPIDPFGGDPMLADTFDPAIERLFTFETEGDAVIPEIGAATIVTSRRFGRADARVVRAVVREARRRRPRIVGYPDVPVLGSAFRRLGSVRFRGDDLAVVLRSGHIAVVPLAPTSRGRVGASSVPVLWGSVGFPVIPAVVHGGVPGPTGVAMGHHRVTFGAPLDLDLVARDPLSGAELAAAARDAVQALYDHTA